MHVDGAPHGRVLGDVAPHGANTLNGGQDLDRAELQENGGRHVTWKVEPVSFFAGVGEGLRIRRRRRCVHRRNRGLKEEEGERVVTL